MTGPERRGAIYEFGSFRLDPRRRSLTRADGTPVPLTAKVFDALVYLVEHAGGLVSRDELTKALWPKAIVEENNLNVTISALRRALGEDAAGRPYIVTVAGRGYQFVADVRAVDTDAPAAGTAGGSPVSAESSGQPEKGAGVLASDTFGVRHWAKRAAGRRGVVLAGGAVLVLAVLAAAGWFAREQRAAPTGDSASIGSVSRVSLVTTFTGREQTPALSPDGTQVAFAWDGGGDNEDIYVLRIGAQQPLRLTQDAALDHSPAWSPDGSQIAFVRQHDLWSSDMIVVPALGGAERKLQSIRVPLGQMPVSFTGPVLAWSPDGTELVFTTQVNASGGLADGFALQRLSLADGLVRPLKLAGKGYDTSPAFSPDASRLAFARYDAVTRDAELMVQELGPGLVPRGEPHPVPGSKFENPRSPVWSPDGSRLVFAKGSQILEWASGAEPRTVHAAAGWLEGMSVAWRAGQRPLAVAANVEDDFDIWALPLDPSTRTAIGPPQVRLQSTARDWHPRFSPDGRHIAFTSWRGGGGDIWIADADGRNLRQLSRIGAVDPGNPRWSPDGAQLSFVAFAPDAEPHTYVVNPSEGLPTLLTHGSVSDWARDGEHLYTTELGSVPRIVRYARAGGDREPLTNGGAAQETVDGERLLYARSDAPGIFTRSVHGGAEERLVEDYAFPPSAGFQPVEGGFYYVSYTPDARARAFRFYDDAEHSASDVAPVPANAGVVWGLTVSPDGRELLFGAPTARADIVLLEF